MKKKKFKNLVNPNQRSFHYKDYYESNKLIKNLGNSRLSEDRIYLLFFLFITLYLIFNIKIFTTSLQKPKINNYNFSQSKFIPIRRDIVDRNGIILSRNISSHHAAIKPSLIKNKKKFILNIKIIFPKTDIKKLEKNLKKNKYFYLKKRLTIKEKNKLWSLGEKGVIFEPFQTRIYPHANLFSHVLGQVDYENNGLSGVEKYFDYDLKKIEELSNPIKLTLDTNIQYLIRNEIEKSLKTFDAKGGAGILMNVKTGEILSLVSLPDFDINLRQDLKNKKYLNKITKGVFELGSIFKTFTIALAIDNKIVAPDTIIKNIPRKINCSKHKISDIKKFPENLSVEEILIRSSNVGTLLIAQKIGEEKFKEFFEKVNLVGYPLLEINELGYPLNFEWNKCKLETVSFGRGITTTPLQATTAYASIVNGGKIIQPTLHEAKEVESRIISEETSFEINKILRKVVTSENGTASLANVFGYDVAGKTGTSKKYHDEEQNLNTFISVFPSQNPKYVLLIMLDEPKIAKDLVYNYRGLKIKSNRNEAGWNAVYVAGKIIKRIGPILAINNDEFNTKNVVKKINR